MAALDALTGQVTYHQRSHTDTAFLASFWSHLRQVYPRAETIYTDGGGHGRMWEYAPGMHGHTCGH